MQLRTASGRTVEVAPSVIACKSGMHEIPLPLPAEFGELAAQGIDQRSTLPNE
jgi:hypothetical protein